MIKRREFGQRLLRYAAGVGMTSISMSSVSTAVLGGCATTPGVDDDIALQPLPLAKPGISALVIGSGYGSAVTALRLTESGIPVTMLEAGRLWTPGPDGTTFCKPFSPDGRAMWFQNKVETNFKSFLGFSFEQEVPVEAGILEARGPAQMRVYQGKGVGGGSLVNMAMCVPPDRERLAKVLPRVDMNRFFRRYLPRAMSVLGPARVSNKVLSSEWYQYARAGVSFAEKAGFKSGELMTGYDVDYLDLEFDNQVPRSALAGDAGFGNNYGKKSLDKTYLADALGTGLLTIQPLHVVKRIHLNPSGGYAVDVEHIDVKGTVLENKTLTCTHLFLGAGSMGTSELLVRARERGDLPNLNRAVGTKWGPNGDLFVALDNPIVSPSGANQCVMPALYFTANDHKGDKTISEVAPLPIGIPLWNSLFVMIGINPEAGHFDYDAATDAVNLVWAREQNQPCVAAAKFIFDRINSKAGSQYSAVVEFEKGHQFGDNVTYHPLGGVPLSEATDDYGRIREYPGLYVVDSSLIPVGIGANPLLTITALAERNIEEVLAKDLSA